MAVGRREKSTLVLALILGSCPPTAWVSEMEESTLFVPKNTIDQLSFLVTATVFLANHFNG